VEDRASAARPDAEEAVVAGREDRLEDVPEAQLLEIALKCHGYGFLAGAPDAPTGTYRTSCPQD
jgi:hypothetical protein